MNPQVQAYRQYPQAQRGSSAARRPGPMQPTAQQYAQQQAQQQAQQVQQRNALLEHQLAQRRARKPTDRNMPDDIDDMIIGEGVQQYKDLRALERKLDFAMMRKRLDMQETFSRNNKRQRTLKIWITNTASNQPWQTGIMDDNSFGFNDAGESTVQIKVEGKLLEDPEDDILASDDEDDESSQDEQNKEPPPKMTHFFKGMSVEYDKARNNVPDPGWQVEWKKQQNTKPLDVIAFTRKCDENVNININFTRDEQPERYRLSHALAQALDMEEADRAEVVMAIWDYVKCFNLQEDEEKRAVRCDDQLRHIFGREQIYFPQVPELVMQHLHPLPPVKLQYTVRVDKEFVENPIPTVYEVRVSVDDPLRDKVIKMTQKKEFQEGLRQIAQFDEQLTLTIQALQHSKARHTFYKSMSKDPATFVNRWMKSQRRDLEVILGEAGRGGGEDGSGPEFARGGKNGVWGSDAVNEAVRYMLAKPQAQKTT